MKNYSTRRKTGIIAILILAAAAVLISWQVGIVHDCAPLGADQAVWSWFISIRTDLMNTLVTFITHCGDTTTIVILCAILVLSPYPGRLKYGVPVTLASLGGLAVYKPMKNIFMRERPDALYHLVEQGGYSFPSGHSVTSVIVYGLLLYLIRKRCQNPLLKNILSALCLALAVLIGPSRLYVGVHWFTDVAAGWCIGGAVLAAAILIIEKLEERNERI